MTTGQETDSGKAGGSNERKLRAKRPAKAKTAQGASAAAGAVAHVTQGDSAVANARPRRAPRAGSGAGRSPGDHRDHDAAEAHRPYTAEQPETPPETAFVAAADTGIAETLAPQAEPGERVESELAPDAVAAAAPKAPTRPPVAEGPEGAEGAEAERSPGDHREHDAAEAHRPYTEDCPQTPPATEFVVAQELKVAETLVPKNTAGDPVRAPEAVRPPGAMPVAEAPRPLTVAMAENLNRIESLTQRLMSALSQRSLPDPKLESPGHEFYLRAGQAALRAWTTQPAKLIETQVKFWGRALGHYLEAQQALLRGTLSPPVDRGPEDSRFKNPLWTTHPFFNAVKQQYQIAAAAIEEQLADIEPQVDDPIDRKRLRYFTRQIIDMLAPTNFLPTNPDALERALETEGESLVKGLENLVSDIEANHGELLVTLADRNAFTVGENIGATPGKVVFRNAMFELIQYAPTTEQVREVPIIIFPPWINKFYIMDLKPQNSLIRWIVSQGFTLFVVSWKNPGPSYAHVKLEDYVAHGYLRAIDTVKQITDQPQVNAIGYCIAGTTLSLTLALLAQTGNESIKSATFFTTLTDFSDQGEFTTFLQDDFVGGIEDHVRRDGVLQSYIMSRTFSFLRANDLVYKPAIRSYMMGEAPPAFDLLYWNGDGTNLPAQMTVDYLRGLCQANRFAEATFPILGYDVKLADVKVPLMAVACETDHIATARDSFRGVAQMGSTDKTFVMSESGHIAGIINPPGRPKYGHYVSDRPIQDFDDWRAGATRHEGSWWPRWRDWITPRSGAQVAARIPGEVDGFPALADAPGTYVVERDPV